MQKFAPALFPSDAPGGRLFLKKLDCLKSPTVVWRTVFNYPIETIRRTVMKVSLVFALAKWIFCACCCVLGLLGCSNSGWRMTVQFNSKTRRDFFYCVCIDQRVGFPNPEEQLLCQTNILTKSQTSNVMFNM